MFIKGRGTTELYEELLQYHRKENGDIAKVKDDLIDAMRYAYMMRRFAKKKYDILNQDDEHEYKPRQDFW
jgi:hypothetical protein